MMDIYFAEVTCMPADRLAADYRKLLPLIILARVDGKSPAEYITEAYDQDLLRRIAFDLIAESEGDFPACCDKIRRMIQGEQK